MLEIMEIKVGDYDENAVGCNNGSMKPMTVITRDGETEQLDFANYEKEVTGKNGTLEIIRKKNIK